MTSASRLFSVLILLSASLSAAAESAPIGAFAGRYLDSSTRPSRMSPTRTYRSDLVKASPAEDLLYFTIGSTFVGQTLSTFPARLASEALIAGPNSEQHLAFEHSYVRDPFLDKQDVLGDFDWDDRGYKYLAYSDGLVILDEDFNEVNVLSSVSPQDVIVFRSGDSYYALIAIDSVTSAQLWNVTTPATPTFVRAMNAAVSLDKTNDGRAGILNADDHLRVYTFDALAAGTAAAHAFTPLSANIRDITTDGVHFYSLTTPGPEYGRIWRTALFEGIYTDSISASEYDLGGRMRLSYGAGYVIASSDTGASIYENEVDGLTLRGHDYLEAYYDPARYLTLQRAVPVIAGAQTLLIVAANGYGDVFSLDLVNLLTLTQSFSPTKIDSGTVSELTITITNPRTVPATFNLAHSYQAALANGPSTPATTCGGTLTATAGASSFTLSKAMLIENSSCTITIQITSSTPGRQQNMIPAGAISSNDNTNYGPSFATLEVLAPFGPPPSFDAFATSSTHVAMVWIGVSGASSYEIFRNDQPLAFTTDSMYMDTTAAANTAYLYKVRAIGASPSAFSNADLTTTGMFTDIALNAGMTPKAVHITQLRTAVDAVRQLASLAPGTYTDANPTIIKAAHITDLRTALDQARAALLQPALTYTNTITAGTTKMKAVDVTELRAGVR